MPVTRRVLPRINKEPPKLRTTVERSLLSIDRRIAALNDMTLRAALGDTQIIRLYGPKQAGWKNGFDYSVSAVVEVSVAGPLGATVTVEGVSMVADTPGARSRAFHVNPNQTLSVIFSDTSIEARLYVTKPLTPVLDVPTMVE